MYYPAGSYAGPNQSHNQSFNRHYVAEWMVNIMSPCWDESYLVALAQTREIEEFLKYKSQSKNCSERTLLLYRNYLCQLLDYFVKKASEEHIKPFWNNCDQQVISSYYAHLKEKGNTPTTVGRKIAVIGSFFDHMVNKGYLDDNPMKNASYGEIKSNHTT